MPFKQQWLLTASSCLALSLANANETTATENNETTVSTISTIKGTKPRTLRHQPYPANQTGVQYLPLMSQIIYYLFTPNSTG